MSVIRLLLAFDRTEAIELNFFSETIVHEPQLVILMSHCDGYSRCEYSFQLHNTLIQVMRASRRVYFVADDSVLCSCHHHYHHYHMANLISQRVGSEKVLVVQ